MESFICKACGEEVLNKADIVAIDEIYCESCYIAILYGSDEILSCEKIYCSECSEEIFETNQESRFEGEELFCFKCCERKFTSEDFYNEDMLCEICFKQDSLIKIKDKFLVCFKCANEIGNNTYEETFNV